ncbi:hypothetical protein A6A08_24240 [Nocardiopsis sp. TSRI0078]|uniref:DUF485 domain-containing protein n=1 Tax=unclassified Nocardiopsis TaxID=2649073 RepID=UPI0009394466|nr:DUF485 domain-containing protein [Nocardiopsis sp. TSRI0078]OKI20005.1 hypothetical protein A6A08_24240 [Nocardiopsis sp. TSRI0078]
MVEYLEGTYRSAGDQGEVSGPEVSWAVAGRRRARADRALICDRMSVDPRFVGLRRRFAVRSGALVAVFLFSYLSYLLLSAYARDFMSTRIADSVNVALAMGIGQFLLTFVLAWAFGRSAGRSLDPLARELREQAREEEAVDGTAVRR